MKLNKAHLLLPVVIIIGTVIILFIVSLLKSSYGRAFAAIKVDEISAEVSGVNTYFYKVLLFGISAGIAGIAGSIYAVFSNFVTPETFTVSASIKILTICVVGGIGTILGPIIGSVWVSSISEYLRNFGDLEMVIYGVMLVFVIVVMPRGIYPTVVSWCKKLFFYLKTKFLKEKSKEGA
jgi:branched-chain amino acid transport system permease protein